MTPTPPPRPPNRVKGQRHWDDQCTQLTELDGLESLVPPHTSTTLKDARVNFRLGTEGLQVKANYRVDSP